MPILNRCAKSCSNNPNCNLLEWFIKGLQLPHCTDMPRLKGWNAGHMNEAAHAQWEGGRQFYTHQSVLGLIGGISWLTGLMPSNRLSEPLLHLGEIQSGLPSFTNSMNVWGTGEGDELILGMTSKRTLFCYVISHLLPYSIFLGYGWHRPKIKCCSHKEWTPQEVHPNFISCISWIEHSYNCCIVRHVLHCLTPPIMSPHRCCYHHWYSTFTAMSSSLKRASQGSWHHLSFH